MTRPLPRCLCCDGELAPLIDFGLQPLANTYDVTEKFPLAVNRCTECFHLQLSESVDPNILFRDYTYFSGTSKTALRFFDDFADTALSYVPNADGAIDIACNDGTQLDAFKKRGLTTYGVDPADNLVKLAAAKGHFVTRALFEDLGMCYSIRHPLIITAQNVLAHTPRPLDFLKTCAQLMRDNTRLFVTCSQANMIQMGQCDTIYHEHISYFNTFSMMKLINRAGLMLVDLLLNPIHGTSYVFVIAKQTMAPATFRISERFAEESLSGLFHAETYNQWVLRVHNKIAAFRGKVNALRDKGYLLVGCGAAAKGISLLNMAGVKLDCLIDTTPAKQWRIASGMVIWPFEHLAQFKADQPVAFIVLAWNFYDEIVENVKKQRDQPDDIFISTQ